MQYVQRVLGINNAPTGVFHAISSVTCRLSLSPSIGLAFEVDRLCIEAARNTIAVSYSNILQDVLLKRELTVDFPRPREILGSQKYLQAHKSGSLVRRDVSDKRSDSRNNPIGRMDSER